ncbi:MAG: response regulator [Limisphaerales bacterium]
MSQLKAGRRKITILAVDDDPNDRLLIERSLRKVAPDATIHLLEGGDQAIAYLMGEGKFADRSAFAYPTFIITDLKMPGADGFAVLEHIKGNPAWAVIPTVVLSSSADPDDVRTAYLLGASSYQQKPADLNSLTAQMKTLHDYWMNCLVPEVDISGKQVYTNPQGRIGKRFPQPTADEQSRVEH